MTSRYAVPFIVLCFLAFPLCYRPVQGQSPTEQQPDAQQPNDQSLASQSSSEKPRGKQIATVLNKPIFQGDINEHVSDRDNLIRLIFDPLTRHYCKQHGIDRESELKEKIKDEATRIGTLYFVQRAELQRHIYSKHGGRVMVSAFGPTAFDATKKWIREHEKAGDFKITDPKFRADLDEFLQFEDENTLFASPSQIKASFDPALTERFIESMLKPRVPFVPPTQPAKPVLVTIGTVMGKAIQLDQKQLSKAADLSTTLRDAFVIPLEQAFMEKHPEIEPSEAEIAAISKNITSNGEEVVKSLNRSLTDTKNKLKQAKQGTDEYGDLEWSRKMIERKLKNVVDHGRRPRALLLTRPAKLQQYLLDQYGGGRALRRGPHIFAFDAQHKWVKDLEQQGYFKINDPKHRKKFYEYWTKEEVHQKNLTTSPRTVRAWFNPPWIEPSIASKNAVPSGK